MTPDYSTLALPFEKGEVVDADQRMFEACFAILGQYVESELGASSDTEEVYRGYRLHSTDGNDEKAIELWLWYKNELPTLEADCQKSFSGQLKTEPKFRHFFPEIVKDHKLRELIDLRRSLWT